MNISLAKYHVAIKQAKQDYYSTRISSNIDNPKKLWNTANNILQRLRLSQLPHFIFCCKSTCCICKLFHRQISETVLINAGAIGY